MVFAAQQANGVFLFDAPVVQRERKRFANIHHEANGCIVGTLGLQIRTSLGRALQAVAAIERVFVRIAAVLRRVPADVIGAGDLAGDDGLVHGDEVGRPERLRPRATHHQPIRHAPTAGELADHGAADVGKVLVAGGGLHVHVVEQGYLELGESRGDATAALVVRGWTGVDHVRDEWEGVAFVVHEEDRAVQARIAIVIERLAAELQAADESHRAGGHSEQVVAKELDVRQEQFHFVVSVDVYEGALDVGVHAAAERVVGCGGRIRQRLRHQRVGNAVAGDVLSRRPREQHRRLPIPNVAAAAEPLQQAPHRALVVYHARDFREAVVVDQEVQPFFGHVGNHAVRQAVRGADAAEGVVVVVLAQQ